MPAERSSLEPYQQKLFDHIVKVTDKEVKSGKPLLPFSKALVDQLSAQKEAARKLDPKAPDPFESDPLFAKLTGMDQEAMGKMWLSKPTFTTCNTFLGQCASAMGVDQLKTPDPTGGKASGITLGQFEVASVLASRGCSRAWVPYGKSGRPRYGDIFRVDDYHMGVSLGFDGDQWNTIEAGQGGKTQGFDSLKRKSEPWGTRTLLGWVDIKTLLEDTSPLPSWLGGWWKVDDGGPSWWYYFDTDDCVYAQGHPPASTVLAASRLSTFPGTFKIVKGRFQSVQIRWFTEDDEESFVVHTEPKKKDEQVRDPNKDTLSGKSLAGKPLSGVRLPGPLQSGVDYEADKKRKAAQLAARAAAP